MRVRDLADYVPVATAAQHITEDQKIAAKMQRKKHEEAERRLRIFDAKRRTIGVDKAALDAQLDEKKQEAEVQRTRDELFDSQALYFNNVIKMQELEARRKRTELERQTKEYSRLHLNKSERLTADLENPPKYPPPLMEGAEPCGVASLQVFTGEDMGAPRRQRAQAQQCKDWYEQQMFEKLVEKEMHKDDDQVWMQQNKISEEAMENVVRQDRLLRRDLEEGRQEFNLQQTAFKEAQKQQLLAETEEEKMLDVYNQMQSPFLSESTPYVGRNGKILFTEYKGEMTVDSLDAMIQTRDAQLAEREAMKKENALAEKAWARQSENVRRTLIGAQREQQQTKREKMEQMVRENQAIAAAKKQKEIFAQHCVFTNECSDDFWSQFGTSTR
jgi:hypothetical protein